MAGENDELKYTSGFSVGGKTIKIQPAKITNDVTDERVVSTIGTVTSAIPDAGAVSGLVNTVSGTLQTNIDNISAAITGTTTGINAKISTLESYFDTTSANAAKLATSASVANSAAQADKFKTAQKITFVGGATGEVEFDGTQAKTVTLETPYSAISGFGETSLTPSAGSTKGGLVQAYAIEKALQSVLEQAGSLASFKVVTELPDIADADKTVIYLKKTGSSKTDNYEEWVVTVTGEGETRAWAQIGETSIDLTPYAKIEDLSAASANWDKTSAYVDGASGNLQTASGYATDWNTFKTATDATGLTALQNSAISGAEASAWINNNSANITSNSAAFTNFVSTTNTDASALKQVSASAVSGQAAYNYISTASAGIEGSAHSGMDAWNSVNQTSGNWNKAYTAVTATSGNWNDAYDAITGAVTASADMAVAGNAGKIANIGATTAYIDSKIAETVAETIDIVDNIVTGTTPNSAIPNVGAVTAWTNKYATSSFGTVVVQSKDPTQTVSYEASANNDKIKFVGGENIDVLAQTDEYGHPTITIKNTYVAPAANTIAGGNGITANLVNTEYQVSGIDATTDKATNKTKGVTYASYYDEDDKLIHLF